MLQDPSNMGIVQSRICVKYPTNGVKANCTNALDASNAPKGPLSSSKVSYFLCKGLKEAGPYRLEIVSFE